MTTERRTPYNVPIQTLLAEAEKHKTKQYEEAILQESGQNSDLHKTNNL